MKSIVTELEGSYKRLKEVEIQQKVTGGPDAILDRRIRMKLTDDEAIDLAIRILYELVPATSLRKHLPKLEGLVKSAW